MILYKKEKNIGTNNLHSLMQIKKEVADPKVVLRVLSIGQVLQLIPRLHADT